ncbi:MAG: hypothetical protein JWO42_2319 [Chloroflexi bacterium]|nr:hypothetical protein [Chloroflexota bacterium]
MSNLEQTVEALRRRVESLEAEKAEAARPARDRLSPDQGASRRQMLVGSVGVLGALAGGALLGGIEPAMAASAAPQAAVQKHEILQIALTPLRSNGVHWARHEWHLGPQFAGVHLPAVIATAADDYMDHDVTSTCSCSVFVQGKPGAYHAVIMVRGIHARAAIVQVHAIAVAG